MTKNHSLVLPHLERDEILMIRLLIKMGLELLLFQNTPDPYDRKFDEARKFARSPLVGSKWQMAYGIYPSTKDLIISYREDEISPLVTDQLYQYEIGILQNGDVIFFFMYRVHLFACNLFHPLIVEYVQEFNKINNYTLDIIKIKI